MSSSAIPVSNRNVRFILDGVLVELVDVDPERTVLQYLREDLGRTGTKEGCAEGDCGACTVVVADLDSSGQRLQVRALNSCIQFLATLDGRELITVESLGQSGALHPVQKAMVDCHGSQCGFCTPGFVMSLFAQFKNSGEQSRRELDDALAGNLCRCTGYQPIVNAANHMRGLADEQETDWLRMPDSGVQPISPSEQQRVIALRALQRDSALATGDDQRRFFAPTSTAEMARMLLEHPSATILAGGTDVGLWVTKQHRHLDTIIYTGRVLDMCDVQITDEFVDIGAAVTISDALPALESHYPELTDLMTRFASPPIRNAGTLGGNVANGSPIGDSMPALLALGTTVVLRIGEQQRELALDDFYLGYQQTALASCEFVERIRIPLKAQNSIIRSYKISKRFDQDISAVCAAFHVQLDDGKVVKARIAYGGVAAIPKRAAHTEAVLEGALWNEDALDAAIAALATDFQPISDMRASAAYRVQVSGNLLRRFWLETTAGNATTDVYNYGR